MAFDPTKPIKVTLPGSDSLADAQNTIQYNENLGWTFGFINADAESSSNLAYFDAKEPPASPIILQASTAVPGGVTNVWTGQMYVSGNLANITAYRQAA